MLRVQPSLSALCRAFSVRTHLLVGYAGVVTLLAVACTTSWLVAHQVRSDYLHTVQTDDELTTQVELRTKLLDDEETGLRGYLLTDSRVFLQPYVNARRRLPGVRRMTVELAGNEPAVRPLLATMTRRALTWETWASALLRQRNRSTSRDQALLQELRGKRLFDAYRAAYARLLHRLTVDRSRHLASDLSFLGRVDVVLPLIFLVALALVISVLKRTMRAIGGPLRRLERAAGAIGGGDLSTEVQSERIREFATLAATMNQMRQRLRTLQELAVIVGSALHMDEVYGTFARLLRDLVPYDRLTIDILERDRGMLTIVFAAGEVSAIPVGTECRLDQSVTSLSIDTQQCVIRGDLLSLEAQLRFPDEDRVMPAGIRALAIVPLLANGQVIGTLNLGSRAPSVYDEEGLGHVLSLAPLVAAAIENARLYSTLDDAKTELDHLHQVAFTQARRDPLTGLPNRLQLREDLETLAGRVERYGHTYSVILCDVDHFKAYNDHYGHQAGDRILCDVAGTLCGQLRQGDVAYRYGGEEFLILLPEANLESAIVVGQRLRQAIEDLGIAHEGITPVGMVTISLGVAAIDEYRKRGIDGILSLADAALYKAKGAGRNRLVIAT